MTRYNHLLDFARLMTRYISFIRFIRYSYIYYTDSVDIEDVEGFRNMNCFPSNLTNSFVNLRVYCVVKHIVWCIKSLKCNHGD